MMRIGEASRSAGLEASAIRYYESHGIVPRPGRTAGGYRDYTADQIELLRFVRRLRSIALPLDDIREIVSMHASGTAPCGVVRSAIAREAAAIDQKIEDLVRVRDDLARLQKGAKRVEDDWPAACVCHVVDSTIR